MSSVKIDTWDDLMKYWGAGDYKSSVKDVADRLNIGMTKARTLLKGMPRIELSGKLYNEHKKAQQEQGRSKAYRTYYSAADVIDILIDQGKIQAWYGDMRKVFSKERFIAGEEKPFEKEFLKIMNMTFYLRISRSINDIVIEDKGYKPYTISDEGEQLYINSKKDIRSYKELTDKKDIIKYTRMIERDFYMKFSIGEVDEQGNIKRGNIKYLQSIGRQKMPELRGSIENLIEYYESHYH